MSVLIVASPDGVMAGSGSGQIESVNQTTVSKSGITHVFKINRSKTHDLFTAFNWADTTAEGTADANGTASFTMTLDETKFTAALQAIIETATGGKLAGPEAIATTTSGSIATYTTTVPVNMGAATAVAENVFDREIRLEVEAALNDNGVLEYLEGDSLSGFDLTLGAAAGAADMYTKLNASDCEAAKNLLLQLPNERTVTELGNSTDETGSRLPVAVGDQVAFVFDVNNTINITQSDVTIAAASGSNAPALGSIINASYGSVPRKVAFIVTAE